MRILAIYMKVNGVRVYHINMVNKFIVMGINIKEKLCMDRNSEMELIISVKEMFIVEHFITIKVMVLEKLPIKMGIIMKDNGNWENFKGKEHLFGKTEKNMKVNTYKEKDKDSVYITSRMVVSMKVDGKMESNQVKVYFEISMIRLKEFGNRENSSPDDFISFNFF
jgi:hypothetical protein